MTITQLTSIDRQIEIKAPPDRVWRALTDPAELSAWFQVSIEGDIAPGNEVWMTAQHQPCAGQRFRVRFTEMTRPVRFVWQWHPGAVDPAVNYDLEPRTTVTFTLEPLAGGTRLRVVESGFDEISLARRAKVYQDNNQGWPEVLVWLQNHVQAQV